VRYTHETCGSELQVTAYCPCCDSKVGPKEIKRVVGDDVEILKKSANQQEINQTLGYSPP